MLGRKLPSLRGLKRAGYFSLGHHCELQSMYDSNLGGKNLSNGLSLMQIKVAIKTLKNGRLGLRKGL